jgi:hypothetical protein
MNDTYSFNIIIALFGFSAEGKEQKYSNTCGDIP